VGVSGKGRILLACRESTESIGYVFGTRHEVVDGVSKIESNRREDLIITRPTQMYASARSTDPLRQTPFQCRLTILVRELDVPEPARMLVG
jgi:hypothetical protein